MQTCLLSTIAQLLLSSAETETPTEANQRNDFQPPVFVICPKHRHFYNLTKHDEKAAEAIGEKKKKPDWLNSFLHINAREEKQKCKA